MASLVGFGDEFYTVGSFYTLKNLRILLLVVLCPWPHRTILKLEKREYGDATFIFDVE